MYESKGWMGLPPMSPGFQQSLDRQYVICEINRMKANGEDVSEMESKLSAMPGVD